MVIGMQPIKVKTILLISDNNRIKVYEQMFSYTLNSLKQLHMEREKTFAQEAILKRIYEKTEKKEAFQDYNESYSDYSYGDSSNW